MNEFEVYIVVSTGNTVFKNFLMDVLENTFENFECSKSCLRLDQDI